MLMKCPNCGNDLPDTAKMCWSCKTVFQQDAIMQQQQQGTIQQPNGFAGNNNSVTKPASTTSKKALIFGIISIVLPLIWVFIDSVFIEVGFIISFGLALFAIVNGINALKKKEDGKGIALAGLIMGIIAAVGIVFSIIAAFRR